MRDETARKVIPLLALLVLAGVVVYMLLPFKVAGAVRCGPALTGAEPRSEEVTVGLLRPPKACDDAGRNRLVNGGIVALLAVVGGAGALLFPRFVPRD